MQIDPTLNSFTEGGTGERRLQSELLVLFYGALPLVLSANLINASLIAAVFADRIPLLRVAGWYLLMVAMVAGRFAIWVWYRRATPPGRPRGGDDRTFSAFGILGSACSGLLWGAAGTMFYMPDDIAAQVVLVLVLGGMGAGAAASLIASIWAFYLYLIFSVLPFTIRLASIDTPDHWLMTAMCVVYMASLTFLGWRTHGWLKLSLRLRIANTELVRCLEERVEERTEELRTINERLSCDIAERQRAETTLSDYGDRQAAVAVFGQRALSGVALETLFEEAVALVTRRLRIAGCAVLEHCGEGERFLVRATAGWAPVSTAADKLPAGACSSAGYALLTHATVVSDDIARETRFVVSTLLRDAEVRSLAGVVIPSAERPFGVLETIDMGLNRFSADDVSFLQSIANMLAAAIDRKRAEIDIQRLALEDSLTGLPNRILFRERLLQELANVPHSNRLLALMLLDLDHFKDVNDTLGHPTGDRLLAAVAARLRTCVRDGEPPARLGGDEFALILADQRDAEDVAAIACKVVNCIAEPFFVDGHELRLGASVGVTLCPTDGWDPDDLLRNADLALYRAKEQGRNTYEFYAVDMAAQVEVRKALERDLRLAMACNGLDVFYQPQFDLQNGRIAAVEALLRWHHSTRGLLLPDAFIPAAETSGLVVPLGAWVLEQACRQAFDWRRSGLPKIMMAVNLSPSQCRRGDLVASVERIVERCHWDVRSLELEVTEQIFLPQEGSECVDSLRELQRLGVTVSIDDFGTGYSSLGRLQGLPVDKVKIDKCFVSGLGRSRDAELIVRAMIVLGRSLGLEVVAEGVENQEQLDFLSGEGCHGAQGFHLAHPLRGDDMAKLLRRGGAPHWHRAAGRDGEAIGDGGARAGRR